MAQSVETLEKSCDKTKFTNIDLPSSLEWSANMADNWELFKQKFEIYLVAAGVDFTNSEVKTAHLMSAIGHRGTKLYNTFEFKDQEQKNDYGEVIKKFDAYFNQQKDVTESGNQENQSYKDYSVELGDLAASSESGTESKDVSLSATMDKCVQSTKAQEQDISSASNLPKFENESIIQGASDVNISKNNVVSILRVTENVNRGFEVKQIECNNCGCKHVENKCSAFGKIGNNGGKINHLVTKCTAAPVREVDKYKNFDNGWSITIRVNNIPLQVKVVTGAQVNILNEVSFNSLGIDKNSLLPSNSELKSYTGGDIACLGKCTLPCKYNGIIYSLDFFIVPGQSPNILGLRSAVDLKLVNPIGSAQKSTNFMNDFEDLFGNSSGSDDTLSDEPQMKSRKFI